MKTISNFLGSKWYSLRYISTFKADVEVSSDSWNLGSVKINGGLDADGKLDDGFTLDFYHDISYNSKIEDLDKVRFFQVS